MTRLLVTALLLIACETGPALDPLGQKDSEAEEVLSICYNIDSPQHGEICSDKCFQNYDRTEFCWFLSREDCQKPLTLEWQKQNCHLFD